MGLQYGHSYLSLISVVWVGVLVYNVISVFIYLCLWYLAPHARGLHPEGVTIAEGSAFLPFPIFIPLLVKFSPTWVFVPHILFHPVHTSDQWPGSHAHGPSRMPWPALLLLIWKGSVLVAVRLCKWVRGEQTWHHSHKHFCASKVCVTPTVTYVTQSHMT